jgi:hypothetical protein
MVVAGWLAGPGVAIALAAVGDPTPGDFGAQLPPDQARQAAVCRVAATAHFLVDGFRFEALGSKTISGALSVWLSVGPPDAPRRYRIACTYFPGQTTPGFASTPPLPERHPKPLGPNVP